MSFVAVLCRRATASLRRSIFFTAFALTVLVTRLVLGPARRPRRPPPRAAALPRARHRGPRRSRPLADTRLQLVGGRGRVRSRLRQPVPGLRRPRAEVRGPRAVAARRSAGSWPPSTPASAPARSRSAGWPSASASAAPSAWPLGSPPSRSPTSSGRRSASWCGELGPPGPSRRGSGPTPPRGPRATPRRARRSSRRAPGGRRRVSTRSEKAHCCQSRGTLS